MDDMAYMEQALALAREAALEGEVPVGCVIALGDRVVGRGRNRRERSRNALSHGELEAIDQACKTLGGWRLWQCTLYVTLEPCPMCAGAIVNARIPRVVFGAPRPRPFPQSDRPHSCPGRSPAESVNRSSESASEPSESKAPGLPVRFLFQIKFLSFCFYSFLFSFSSCSRRRSRSSPAPGVSPSRPSLLEKTIASVCTLPSIW